MQVPIYWIKGRYGDKKGPYSSEYVERYKKTGSWLLFPGEIIEQIIDVSLRDDPSYHVVISPVTPNTLISAHYHTLLYSSLKEIGYLTFVPDIEQNMIVCSAFVVEQESYTVNGEYREGEYVAYGRQQTETDTATNELFEVRFPLTRAPYEHEMRDRR